MSKNKNLSKAKKEKNDEFYTLLSEVEKELKYYKHFFENKIIYCNANDGYKSSFFKYFASNFNELKIKKLITTTYLPKNSKKTKAIKIEINELKDYNKDGAIDFLDVEYLLKHKKGAITSLKENGDFRNKENIELLKKADIIITTPPFSVFREYMDQLIKYDKKFLIIGSLNAISYKEIFSLIINNKLWLGYKNGAMSFYTPIKDDLKNFGNICWYTNMEVKKHKENLILYKTYNEEEYPKYDNYDAIEVGRVANIPMDYSGVMGVPITFLDKHNPRQFKIIGQMVNTKITEINFGYPFVKGKKKYARILIKRMEK